MTKAASIYGHIHIHSRTHSRTHPPTHPPTCTGTYGNAPPSTYPGALPRCSDIYFALRTRGHPLECDPTSPKYLSFWSIFDCPNREVNSDPATLAITKLEIEVDTRWGDCACPRSQVSLLLLIGPPPFHHSLHHFVHCVTVQKAPRYLVHALWPRYYSGLSSPYDREVR